LSFGKILGYVSGAFIIIAIVYALSAIIQTSIYTIETYVLIGVILVVLVLGIFILMSARRRKSASSK
jgi:membrane protein DedA with SNARE-associated domain